MARPVEVGDDRVVTPVAVAVDDVAAVAVREQLRVQPRVVGSPADLVALHHAEALAQLAGDRQRAAERRRTAARTRRPPATRFSRRARTPRRRSAGRRRDSRPGANRTGPTSCGFAVDPHGALGGLRRVVHAVDEVPGDRRAGPGDANAGRPAPRRSAARDSRPSRRRSPAASIARTRPPSDRPNRPDPRPACASRCRSGPCGETVSTPSASSSARSIATSSARTRTCESEPPVPATSTGQVRRVAALAQHAGVAIPHRPPRDAGAGPTRATAATSSTSGSNTPTQRHAFRGRPARISGMRSGGSGGSSGRPATPDGDTPPWMENLHGRMPARYSGAAAARPTRTLGRYSPDPVD